MNQNELDKSTAGSANERGADAAGQSLADALRVSFRLLKLIMLVVVIVFIVSGSVFSVGSKEVALRGRLGKVMGTAVDRELQPGFHWSLPEPIDRRIRVPKELQSVRSEFWFQMTEQEKAQGRGGTVGASLVPGKDSYVITGDVNILHVNMEAKYRIVDAYRYVSSICGAGDPGRSQPEQTLIRCLGDSAIIESAGQFSVDELIGEKAGDFRTLVKRYLQRSLAEQNCGIKLDSVLIGKIEPPRQVASYFNDVRNAFDEGRGEINKATGEAAKLLTETVGANYRNLLVAMDEERQAAERSDEVNEASETVSKLLPQSEGKVQGILGEAMVYRTRLVESAKVDAEYLEKLLPDFNKYPDIVVSRMLLNTIEKIMDNMRVYYIPKKPGQIRLQIERDPREMEQAMESESGQKSE